MSAHVRFRIVDLDQLRAEIARLGLDLPVDTDLRVLGECVRVGRFELPNRFAVHPMEGFDAGDDGAPGPLAFRRYRRYAAGGAGLIWFEATAVLREARSNPGQFWLHEGSVETFARLVAETRRAAAESWGREPLLILQLTHSGRYSKPAGLPRPLIAHRSPILDPLHRLPADYPVVSDDYLDALQETFVAAARLAAQAGFDGIDVKACHRYLVSELLASFTRPGRYGGSFENRTRLLRETVARIQTRVPGLLVTTRMNAFDAISYPYGWGVAKDDAGTPDLADPLALVCELRKTGLPLLNVTIGNPYFNPHYGRPYDFPVAGMKSPAEHPLEGMARMLGIAATIQRAQPGLPVVSTGYAWVRHFMPYIAAGVVRRGWATLVGQGRGSFAYPDAVRDILEKGEMVPEKCCVSCSGCTQIMRDGAKTGCVVRDSEIYGPQYRLGRRYAMDRLLEEARRCRDCDHASCTRGCAARIDIPAFIKAFADGDIAGSYAILKAGNVLPEMCGTVCPACEQCQGQCIERVFCERPVPIQDIQLVVARTARLQGITAVKMPDQPSGRRVGIMGGGPAGLACAIKALEAGHTVVLHEAGRRLGGIPDTTIPEPRYGDSEAEVNAILAPALAAGRLAVCLGSRLGHGLDLAALRREYDAVFLAVGLSDSTSLGHGQGVEGALDFLRAVKSGTRTGVPERVAVLGGGNTAMDAATTARRLGARDVYLVYRRSFAELPAWSAERNQALDAGVHFLILTQPFGYDRDTEGRLKGLLIARTQLGEPDASGRRRPAKVAGTESLLPVDLVVEAIGQQLSEAVRAALDGIEITPAGRVAVKPGSQATSVSGVYAGGDLVNGGATAVEGIVEGMRAADEINRFLG